MKSSRKTLGHRNPAFVLTFLVVLALAGCGQKEPSPSASGGDNAAPAPAGDSTAAVDAAQPSPAADTNAEPPVAYGLAKQLQDSAFAAADPAVKESYARALIAYDIGDFDRAWAELVDLANSGTLTDQQLEEVKTLLGNTTNAAPGLATNLAASPLAASGSDVYALAAEGQPPLSTADPAVRETFDRAKTAFDIGNFEVAAAELQDLATNTQLNAQQRYAVQKLLDQTPRAVPGGTRR